MLVPGGAPCSCGKRGCLVTVAGPDVLLREAGLSGLARTDGFPAAEDELFRRVDDGDATARAAVRGSAAWLRLCLVNLCMTLQPSVVVLGGYLPRLRDLLVDGVADDGLGGAGLPGTARGRPRPARRGLCGARRARARPLGAAVPAHGRTGLTTFSFRA